MEQGFGGIKPSILETIGNTPAVRLNRMPGPSDAEVLVKIEYFNPGSSVKDRPALSMVEAAQRDGKLKPGGTIVEHTSGNMGIGLALVAAVRGYEIILTMPESFSVERRKILSALGAKIILTESAKGMAGAVAKAGEIVAQNSGFFMPQQFNNPANVEVHARTTAREILRDAAPLDAFVAGIGTGGTISGVGAVLKKESPQTRVIAVEPASSPVLSGGKASPHKIQGIGAGFVPAILRREVIDEIIAVSDGDALSTARRLAKEEGILGGISSGANAWAALEVSRRLGKGKRVLTMLPDTAERYMSTALFEGA